jgi:hypothetical protein
MGVTGFEPVTSSMSTTHSNQLSYTPDLQLEFNSIKVASYELTIKIEFSSGGGT